MGCSSLGDNVKWYSHLENSLAVTQMIKQLPYDPVILLLGICSREHMSTQKLVHEYL